jgi:two-component system sensor kinase FixL
LQLAPELQNTGWRLSRAGKAWRRGDSLFAAALCGLIFISVLWVVLAWNRLSVGDGLAMTAVFFCLGAALALSTLKRKAPRLASMVLATCVTLFTMVLEPEILVLRALGQPMFGGRLDMPPFGVAVGAGLGIGVLALTRDVGWLAFLLKGGRVGRLVALWLPVTLAPAFAAVLANAGMQAGLYTADGRMVLIVDLSAITLLVLVFWGARGLVRERREREELSGALELSAVFVRADDGRIEHWPHGCEALYGWTAAEAVGRVSHNLLKTEFPAPLDDIKAALERDGEWRGDLRRLTREGEVRWVAAQWVRQGRGGGAPARVVEIVNDITDLKRKDAALRDSQDRLTQALATYELGILDYDPRTGRAVYSRELEHIAGVAPGALGDSVQNWFALKPAEDRERTHDEIAADASIHKPQSPHAIRIRRADGDMRELHGVRRYVYADDGQLQRVIGIYMDVTEQLRDRAALAARDSRLREMQSELADVSRLSAMGEMAAALAHELNQPLTAIGNSVGAIGMVLERTEGPLEPQARERLLRAAKHSEAQAVRAGEIVRRLREFIVRGEADSRVENLNSLIADAVALAMPNPLARDVTVVQQFAPEATTVLADRIQIQQVLVNLIRNSLEAMRDDLGSRVLTIRTLGKGVMAEIVVEDTGPGIAEEVAARLFSPFVSTKSNGMGVGLSICRRIVEAHGGAMWSAPATGGGAEIHFTLPLISQEERHARQPPRSPH